MKRIAYLLCEIKGRDLDSRLLIASHLLNAGFTVVIGQRWGIGENRLIAPTGCYLFPTANQIQGAGMAQIRDAGHLVIASDEEALAAVADTLNSDESISTLIKTLTTASSISLENCHAFLVCSNTHKEVLGRQFPDYLSKIKVTGSTRIDALKATQATYDEQPPYVLVNTGFPLINSIWDDDTAVRAATESLGEEAVQLRLKGQRAGMRMMPEVMRWLQVNHRVVIRPHPGERIDFWRNEFPQTEIIKSSPPIPWIKGARVLIHANSTTGLEAAAMGTPTLNLDPLPAYGDINIIKRINYTVSTTQEAITALSDFFENGEGLAAKLPTNSLFPPNGAKNTAKVIVEQLGDRPPPTGRFDWAVTARTDKQRDKFTASLEEIVNSTYLKAARSHSAHQLDDSVFLLNPGSITPL